MQNEKKQVLEILEKYNISIDSDFDEALDNHKLYIDLFSLYMGEMPYGTAKARDDDPFVWIDRRLTELFYYDNYKNSLDK